MVCTAQYARAWSAACTQQEMLHTDMLHFLFFTIYRPSMRILCSTDHCQQEFLMQSEHSVEVQAADQALLILSQFQSEAYYLLIVELL